MNIFISYSVHDTALVSQLDQQLVLQGHSTEWWGKSKKPGREVWGQIFDWIDNADVALVIITEKTVKRAMAVGNEVGRALAMGKRVIPLVAAGVPESELGCLKGVAHIEIDPANPQPAIDEVLAGTQPSAAVAVPAPTPAPLPEMDLALGLLVVGVVVLLALALVAASQDHA